MSSKQLSQKEIHFFAEQVLLGQKHWSDLEHLSDDDKLRVRTVVERGIQALAESPGKGRYLQKKLRHKRTKLQGKRGYVYVPDRRPKSSLMDLAQGVPIPLFPVENLATEDGALRCRMMEHLLRHFSAEEVGLIFKMLPVSITTVLLGSTAPAIAEEIELGMSKELEVAATDQEVLDRRFSMAIVQGLQEEDALSEHLAEVLGAYVGKVREHLAAYCTDLPKRVALDRILSEFSHSQWKRLAGLTPRDELAAFYHLLGEREQRLLVGPLPERQQDELQEYIALKAKQRESDLDAFVEVVQSFKQWTALVNKIGREP